jgi:hypothetical protein
MLRDEAGERGNRPGSFVWIDVCEGGVRGAEIDADFRMEKPVRER